MSVALVRFSFELVFNSLPIKSGNGDYNEVENDPTFVNSRLLLINAATTYNINSTIEETLQQINIITKQQQINTLSEKALHSLIVVLRLLSDIAETCWKHEETEKRSHADQYLNQDDAIAKNDIGFATQKPCFHVVRPKPIDPAVAERLIQAISRLKFTYVATRASRKPPSSHYTSSTNVASSPKIEGTNNSSVQDSSPFLRIIDTNLDYLGRFVSAANPKEFCDFLDTKIITPLTVTHSSTEGDIMPYMDMFSAFYITFDNLPTYLQNVSKILESLKRTTHQEMMLTFSSHALMNWIISRPHEYVEIISDIKNCTKDDPAHIVCKYSSSLFDDVHSNFNVSYLLTTTINANAAISEFKSSPSSSDVPSPISSSGSSSLFQSDTADLRKTHSLSRRDSDPQSYLPKWDILNPTAIAGTIVPVEDVANVSVLRFLVVMLMFQPNTFEELNLTSFKHIPDEQDILSNVVTDEERKKSQPQLSKPRQSNHRMLQTLKFPTFTSGSKKVKFLTSLIKNVNGSLVVSDTSLLDTLRTLVLLFRVASSIYLADEESPVVTFSRRLLFVIGDALQLCDIGVSKKNPVIARCLSRNPTSCARLQIAFFTPALIMDSDTFTTRLGHYSQNRHSGYKHLKTLTEGFKLFYSIPNVTRARLEMVMRSTDFFKRTLTEMSDVILTASKHFSDDIASIVEGILNGSLRSSTDVPKVGRSLSPHFPFSPQNQSLYQEGNNKVEMSSLASSSSISSGGSSYNEKASVQKSFNERSDIMAPRARRPSGSSAAAIGNVGAKVSHSSEGEKSLPNVRLQLENVQKGAKSPLRFSRSRGPSDGSLPALNTVAIHQRTLTENVAVYNQSISSTELANVRATLVNIISVYELMIHDYFVTVTESDPAQLLEDYIALIKPLFVGLVDDNFSVQAASKSFAVIIASYALKLGSGNSTSEARLVLYKGAAYLITLLSATLFNLELADAKREQLLDVILKFLDVRFELKSTFDSGTLKSVELETYHLLHGATGRALLASLCTHEPKIHKLLRTCFKAFLRELDSHDDIMGHGGDSISYNRMFFQSMGRDNYVSSGAVAFQRRLRSDILKHVTFPDRMLFDTLKLMYNQWLFFLRKENLSSAEASHFRNLAGLIASGCGTFLSIDRKSVENNPQYTIMQEEVTEMVDYFLSRQCSWLNDPALLTRENSKDIVGTELHPLAFKLLFKHLKLLADHLETIDLTETQGPPEAHSDASVLLLEQVILIVRTVLEREDTRDELILVSPQLLGLVAQLFKIVENVSHASTRYYKAIIHLSKLLKSFEATEGSLCISGYLLVKNQWLRLTISWFKAAIFMDFDPENLARPHREMDLKRRDLDYLYIDTSIETSRALAYITKDLMLEVPLSNSESELKGSKAVTFGNYFSILLKGLEKTSAVENYPLTLRHKIGVLNDNINTSLTNILNANVDVGLKYALPLGYSKNLGIKLAFLKVFVEIISNFDIHTAKATIEKNKLVDRYVSQLLVSPRLLSLAARVCPANEIDAFASSLLGIFEIKNASHIVVVELMKDEIQNASRYADVLRRNSCATRALSMLSRLKGTQYLRQTLKPVLMSIIESNEAFEIEKITLEDPEAEKNVKLFTKYLKLLIDSVANSVSSFPPEFFLICQAIYLSVQEKFPGYESVAVGSFIFLRFFCPAIVSPDAENIVDVVTAKQKRSFVTLAKVVQNIANGSISSMKWPLLNSESSFLRHCGERVSIYLSEIANPSRIVSIKLRSERKVAVSDFNYLHRYIYQHGLEVRSEIISEIKTLEDFETSKSASRATDNLLTALGQPRMEFRNEIPPSIRDKSDENPDLYDFMSRHSLRTFDFRDDIPFIHEAVSSDGHPIVVFTYKLLQKQTCDTEALVYRTFQVYSKIWSSRHYFVIDCTGFDSPTVEDKKLLASFFRLIPDEAARNCSKFYYYNMTEEFTAWWLPVFKGQNPYLEPYKTPHEFINSDSSPSLIKNLKLNKLSYEVFSDVRVTLRDVSLYDHVRGRFTPVVLKIGNKYVQMISETPYRFKVTGIDEVVELRFNAVYEVGGIVATVVSFETGVPSEFTINFDNATKLVFCSSKYLEIIRIFYYAQAKIEEEYENSDFENEKQNSQSDEKELNEILGSLLLVIYAGFCSDNDEVKNISYNVLAATQKSFGINFGCNLRVSPEVHVPHDTSAFCDSLFKGLSQTAPHLSLVVWKSILEGLSGVFEVHHIPHIISALTPWTENLYRYVYLADDENGPENVSHIIRALIKLSVKDVNLILIYNQCIWTTLILQADLVSLIVDEIVSHSIDRESEGGDWKSAISLLTRVSTVEMCSEVVKRVLRISRSFLPSLKLEASTNSWSELIILINILVALFFDSLLLSQLFLPEILYLVSLLIDVGPSEMRLALHKLLMNVCQSLSTNEDLSSEKRENLDSVKMTFSRQKMRFMSGFSQDKGRMLQSFSASSFLSKFTTLEQFVSNIILLMENSSNADSQQWKAKYNKYLMDSAFNDGSFLSARAAMIVGIIGQQGISEFLCKNMLSQTIKNVAEPYISDELVFFVISHSFTYSKVVLGIQPDSPLLKQLFWLATTFAQSPNSIFYHGGLLFMANSVRQISSVVRSFDKGSLTSVLFDSRKFAEPLLIELESMVGIKWTKQNFSHVILNLVSKGMLVPYIKTTSVDCLVLFLTLAYEDLAYAPNEDYLCYLLVVYQVSRPSKFKAILVDLKLDVELVFLDEQNFVPKVLLEWMVSDSEASLIALYQASVYFASGSSDELSKTRYLLLLERLLKENPLKVIKIYALIRMELKRVSTFDVQSDFPQLVFTILQTIVTNREYGSCDSHFSQTNRMLKMRHLSGLQNIEVPYNFNDTMAGFRSNPYALYERKKLTVKIMSRMISYRETTG
ncbi:LADA_0F05556g1_1 [Lachancea dasiensis]|uniref:LADA_0F05556g1_1 n=1 Tax=Lachancea dasiensis TaxID=1072105 RepID=A0A1G4JJZ7_9SACH|nr:LADA_0F05556g1_1 [Lachancea dasiensis]